MKELNEDQARVREETRISLIDSGIEALQKKLALMLSSSCHCLTKTPDVEYHNEHCPYTLIWNFKNKLSAISEERKNKNVI